MLERVKKLEEKVSSISSDLAVIKATMCTKEELHKELNSQTWKIIIALVVTVLIALLSKYFLK
ncbi:emp24/gp25L/p24 family protein [Klebsiella aerogenes]|nr:emp24/gp25L/p24 family protein [Klebsiella aerogenes]